LMKSSPVGAPEGHTVVVPDAAAVREFPPPDKLMVGVDCEGAAGWDRVPVAVVGSLSVAAVAWVPPETLSTPPTESFAALRVVWAVAFVRSSEATSASMD